METKRKGKAIIGIAMIVAVLASAVGAVSGEFFNADDCPECPDARLSSPRGSFGLHIGNYNPVFASEPFLKVLSCLYNYNFGRAENPDSGVIKIGAYISPDRGLDADKALSDFNYARENCLEYCESSPGTEKLRDKNDGDDREFVYISKDDMFCCGPCYRYDVRGYLLYREKYLIYVYANAEYKDQRERYCEPVGDNYLCYSVKPDDKTHLLDDNDAIKRFDALAECAKRVIDKKCGDKEDGAIIKPDNTSCKDFYVDSKDFDLAYDNKMLRTEFLYFLYDYGSKHELKSASEKYDAEWFSSDFFILEMFLFTDEIKEWRFLTGKEDNLGKRIDERFKKEGRALKPAEVFEESLKINDNCVFDALLTAHNYLKNETHLLRGKRQDCKMLINQTKKEIKELEEILQTEGAMGRDGEIYDSAYSAYITEKAQKALQRRSEKKQEILKQEELMKDPGSFKRLKELRSKTDNEGAWYHLFLTATMGYGERKYEWDGAWGKTLRNIFFEHRIYKGIWEWKWLEIDNVEYCWDIWGGYLGCEIYSTLLDNQEKVKERIKEHPEVWVKGEWDPSYIIDAYTGQKIYE